MAIATVSADGASVTARCCGYMVWQGSVVARGRDISPATVVRRVLAERPEMRPEDAFREPWARRMVLGLEDSPSDSEGGRDRRKGGDR